MNSVKDNFSRNAPKKISSVIQISINKVFAGAYPGIKERGGRIASVSL